jgi:ubiquinone/menaquinone biosynthesis C-methylase UbiE
MSSKAYFADVAPEWDQLRTGFFTPQMRDDAISRAQLAPNAVVADIGTGTGFVIEGLLGNAGQIDGYDESEAMLAVARQKFAGRDEVQFFSAESESIPAPDATYDAVFANMYLHHVPDPAAAIAEMARILKPGGKLVITDLDTHDQTWMRTEMADRWLGFARETVISWMANAGLKPAIDCAAGTCDCSDTPDGSPIALSIFVAIGTMARDI